MIVVQCYVINHKPHRGGCYNGDDPLALNYTENGQFVVMGVMNTCCKPVFNQPHVINSAEENSKRSLMESTTLDFLLPVYYFFYPLLHFIF